MRKTRVLAAAAAAFVGLTLMGGTAAAAAEAPAPTAQVGIAASPITVDKPVVVYGDTVRITVNHGPEAMVHVASEAFGGKGSNPDDPARGYAQIVSDINGVATYQAVIDAAPGTYTIDARVGGGNVEPIVITVQ